ncbi:MAG: dockerin type I domain-containing protein [Phycisphaerales bacterium JB043]
MRGTFPSSFVTLVVVCLATSPGLGQTAEWNNPIGGNIFDLSNWSFLDLPPVGPLPTHMRFSLDASYTVDIPAVPGGARTSTMLVDEGTLTLRPKGDISLHLEGTSDPHEPGVRIFASGAPTRVISQAALVAPTGMTIGGIPGATLETSNILSTGDLTLGGSNGTTGMLHVRGEAGHLRVGSLADSEFSWLDMAPSGNALLHISDGAQASLERIRLTGSEPSARASVVVEGPGSVLALPREPEFGRGTSSIVIRDGATLRSTTLENDIGFFFDNDGSHSITLADGARLEGIRDINSYGSATVPGRSLTFSNTSIDLDNLRFGGSLVLENNAELTIRDLIWFRNQSHHQILDSTIAISPEEGAGIGAIRLVIVLSGDNIEIRNSKILNETEDGLFDAASVAIGTASGLNRILIDNASVIESVGACFIWTHESTRIAGPGTRIEQRIISSSTTGGGAGALGPFGGLQLGGGDNYPFEPRPTLTIADGATIDTTFLQFRGVDASFVGSASTLIATNQMNIERATVELSPSVRIETPELIVGARSGTHLLSILSGNGTIDATLHNNGVVSPSGERPVMHIAGDYDQRFQAHFDFDDAAPHLVTDGRLHEGTLEIDIDRVKGKLVTDRLVVEGQAKLDGTIIIRLGEHVVPRPGLVLTFIQAGSIVGGFRDGSLPEGPPSVVPSLRYADTSVSLVYRSRGDINRDSVIDGTDLGMLLARWGSADPSVDINLDGTVDSADLSLLLADWGD